MATATGSAACRRRQRQANASPTGIPTTSGSRSVNPKYFSVQYGT